MSSLMKDLANASRGGNPGRNIAFKVQKYVDCDVKDSDRNKVIGIDMETGDTIEVQMSKHEDTGNNKRRDIHEMAAGSANNKVPVGGTVLFQNARMMGEAGGMKRYRATWTDGLLRTFRRDENEGIVRDKDGNPELAGIVTVSMARVLPIRKSRNGDKLTQAAEVVAPERAIKIETLDDLKAAITKILDSNLGQPFALIRIASMGDKQMLTRAVAKRQEQTSADAVEDFFANVKVGQMLAAVLAEGVPADHVMEVIPGAKFYFGPKSVEIQAEIEDKNKAIEDPRKRRPTAASVFTAKREAAVTREGQPYDRLIQGYATSAVALAEIGKGDDMGLIAVTVHPTSTRPQLLMRNQLLTSNINFECEMAEPDNSEELEPDEADIAAAKRPMAAA